MIPRGGCPRGGEDSGSAMVENLEDDGRRSEKLAGRRGGG